MAHALKIYRSVESIDHMTMYLLGGVNTPHILSVWGSRIFNAGPFTPLGRATTPGALTMGAVYHVPRGGGHSPGVECGRRVRVGPKYFMLDHLLFRWRGGGLY